MRILYTCFSILSWCCIQAQTLPSTRYTTADGLVSDRITCMVQDQQGFLWAGSFFGLSRYDGYSFVNVSLPPIQQNKYITALTATDGALYAGFLFGGGLMVYQQGKTAAYAVPPYKGVAFNNVLALCPHSSKGVLVCGSLNSVYHFSDGAFRFLFALDSTYDAIDYRYLSMDPAGNIWIATDKGLLVFTAAGKLLPVSKDPTFSVQSSAKGTRIVSMINNKAVMSLVKMVNGSFYINKLTEAGPAYPVPQDNFQPDHTWLVDTSGRFIHLTPQGKTTDFFTTGLARDDVHFLYSDRENNVWIATHTGLVKMPNQPSGFFPFAELANGSGFIGGSDSVLWISNGRNLYCIRNEEITKIEPVKTRFTGTLLYKDNWLWVGNHDDGLFLSGVVKDKILSTHYFDAFDNKMIRVHTITHDANGDIWVCGQNGIFYFQEGKPVAHFEPLLKDGQPAFIVSMTVDSKKQVIWAGDNAQGLLKIHYETSGSAMRFEVQNYIDSAKGLTDGFVRSMLLDSRGAVWVGTRFRGLYRIREKDNQVQVQNLSAEAGMNCTRVSDIRETGEEAIWVSTCNGIYQYNHSSGKWKAYTRADGLEQAEVFANYVSRDEKRCWAVSSNGVTAMMLSGEKEIPPPLINLIRISVLGKEDSAALFRQDASDYHPDENSIGFQFAAASYTDEKKLWYKYRLEGYDQSWSVPTQSNSVNYAYLPPGNYTFKVLASADNQQWSAKPAEFSFSIQKPFYKSTLFFILILGVVIGGFYFFHTYRLRQKLKLERLRTRISADLHDDIGSTLSSISIISEGAMQEKDTTASKQMMKEIMENTQMLMDKMDDIIWTVNPQNDSLQNLMLRITKFASSVFEARGIDYSISIDKHISDISLPMNQRQHLYLILKEAVNNLVKYSCATHAEIIIHYDNGYLLIKVADNGKGFEADKRQTGNGLRNMQRRASMMQAVLNLESNKGGTTVALRTKIK